MESHTAHLDMSHSTAYMPRITNPVLLKSLAESALQHVPNSSGAIQRAFKSTTTIKDPHKLVPAKI